MGIQVFPIAASGPTLAEITSAITSNAAPASVTNSSIATQVANNSLSTENWTLIGSLQTTTAATYTFSSIPSGYKKLMLIAGLIKASSGNVAKLTMRFNNDSSSLYSSVFMYASGSPDYYSEDTSAFLTRSNWGNTTSTFKTEILNGSNPMKFSYTQGVIANSNSGAIAYNFIMNTYKSATEINRIDLLANGDNIVSGTAGGVALYGAK